MAQKVFWGAPRRQGPFRRWPCAAPGAALILMGDWCAFNGDTKPIEDQAPRRPPGGRKKNTKLPARRRQSRKSLFLQRGGLMGVPNLWAADVAQHLVGVGGGVDLGVGLFDAALGVYQVADAGRVLGVGRVSGAVDLADGSALVAEQVVGKVELDAEGLVFGRRVATDADDDGVARGEFRGSITEPLAFDGSARGVGLGIPPEQQAVAAEILQVDR